MIVNGLWPRPILVWRKKTGPLLFMRIAIAVTRKSGASTARPNTAPATSIVRFASRWDAPSSGGVSPRSGVPSSEYTPARLPTTSKRRGTMSTCTPSSLHTLTTSRPAS